MAGFATSSTALGLLSPVLAAFLLPFWLCPSFFGSCRSFVILFFFLCLFPLGFEQTSNYHSQFCSSASTTTCHRSRFYPTGGRCRVSAGALVRVCVGQSTVCRCGQRVVGLGVFTPSAAAEVCPFGKKRAGVQVPFPAAGLARGLRVAPSAPPPPCVVTPARMQGSCLGASAVSALSVGRVSDPARQLGGERGEVWSSVWGCVTPAARGDRSQGCRRVLGSRLTCAQMDLQQHGCPPARWHPPEAARQCCCAKQRHPAGTLEGRCVPPCVTQWEKSHPGVSIAKMFGFMLRFVKQLLFVVAALPSRWLLEFPQGPRRVWPDWLTHSTSDRGLFVHRVSVL